MAGSNTYIDDCDCYLWDTTSFCNNNDLKVTDEKGTDVCGGNCSIKGQSILVHMV